MIEVELYVDHETFFKRIRTPIVPHVGEYISIEAEEYFKYYTVKERWLRVTENEEARVCVLVELDD